MTSENQDVAIVMSTNKMSKLKHWLLLRKLLPKPSTKNFLDPEEYTYVSDSDAVIGEQYLTNLKEVVTVLDRNLIFMGYSLLIEYSNGAIRWNSYTDPLYKIED